MVIPVDIEGGKLAEAINGVAFATERSVTNLEIEAFYPVRKLKLSGLLQLISKIWKQKHLF